MGVFVLLIMSIFPGTPGHNRYGPNPLLPQQGIGGYGYTQPGHSYSPPPSTGGYGLFGSGTAPDAPESDMEEQRFCTQCGMQLQADARFCTVCGTAA